MSSILTILNIFLDKITAWDHAVNGWVLARQNKIIRKFFEIITCLGTGYVWLPVYFIVYLRGSIETKRIVFTIIVAELLGCLIIIVLRNLVPRERPIKDIRFLIDLPWNKNSFPSQHALRAALLTVVGGRACPAGLLFFSCAALLVLFSRIYLQRHYLSDVLAGSALGIFCALASLAY